jgi:A/G-specific adenine glycosylase
MDFGAVICKPQPLCSLCPFQKQCYAFQHNKINELPLKKKKINIRKRWFYYLILEYKNEIAIRQRKDKDIWQDLYEFPMVEKTNDIDAKAILLEAEKKKWIMKKGYTVLSVSPIFKQQLSHQLIAGQFINLNLKKKPQPGHDPITTGWRWVMKSRIGEYAFPQFINQYLRKTG